MGYTETLWLFATVILGIVLVPGLDMTMVMACALGRGRAAGIAATLGIMTGGVAHTVFGAFGVGIVLRLVPQLVTVMLAVGGAYLVWIAWQLLRLEGGIGAVEAARPASAWRSFRQGALTNLMNPKAYLFSLAVLPSFIRPEFGPLTAQVAVLALIVIALQFSVYAPVAAAAAAARRLLTGTPRASILTARVAGLVLLAAAAVTFLQIWRG